MRLLAFICIFFLSFVACKPSLNTDGKSVEEEKAVVESIDINGDKKILSLDNDFIKKFAFEQPSIYHHAFERVEENNEIPFSHLRPHEEIKKGVSYIDTLEYIDFNDEGDFEIATLKKDSMYIDILMSLGDDVHRGDIISFEWSMQTFSPAGDSEAIWTTEEADFIKVIQEGALSRYIKKYAGQISLNLEELYNRGFYKNIIYTYLMDGYCPKVTDALERGATIVFQHSLVEIESDDDAELGNEYRNRVSEDDKFDIYSGETLLHSFVMHRGVIYEYK